MESLPSLALVQVQTMTTTSPMKEGSSPVRDGITEMRSVLRRLNQRDKGNKRMDNNNDTKTSTITTPLPINGSKFTNNFSLPNLSLVPSSTSVDNSNHVEMVGLLKSMLDSTLQALKISQEKLTDAYKRIEEGQKENVKLKDELRNLRAQVNPPQLLMQGVVATLPPKRKRQGPSSSSRSTSPSSLNHRSDSPPQLSPQLRENICQPAFLPRPTHVSSSTSRVDIFHIQKSEADNCMTAHVPYHFYESEASQERTATFEQENDYQIHKPDDSESIEIPRWRQRSIEPKRQETEENLDDQVFLKRHNKWEIDERRRKRWDSQQLREKSYLERLKRKKVERELQKKKKQRRGRGAQQNYKENDEESTFQPSVQDASFIRVQNDIPISVFGYPLPIIDEGEFELPWSVETKPRSTTVSHGNAHGNTHGSAPQGAVRGPGRPRLDQSTAPRQPYNHRLQSSGPRQPYNHRLRLDQSSTPRQPYHRPRLHHQSPGPRQPYHRQNRRVTTTATPQVRSKLV